MCIKLVFHGEWHDNGAARVSTGYDSSAVWWSYSGSKNKENRFFRVTRFSYCSFSCRSARISRQNARLPCVPVRDNKLQEMEEELLLCVLETPARTTCAGAYYRVRSLKNESELNRKKKRTRRVGGGGADSGGVRGSGAPLYLKTKISRLREVFVLS